MSAVSACIIVIGNEILVGVTQDTNSSYIAKNLQNTGISVKRIISIPDETDTIISTMRDAAAQADIVITTGGLGPTRDDKTKTAYQHYFGKTLIRNEQVYTHLKSLFESRGKPELLAINEHQAYILEGADLLFNRYGTAPGMGIYESGKYFVMLPGVPSEMKQIFQDRVLPALQRYFTFGYLCEKIVMVYGIPESMLSQKLENWEDSLPEDVSLSYLPDGGRVKLRLSKYAGNAESGAEQLEKLSLQACEILGKAATALSVGGETEQLLQWLKNNKLTIATAESVTAGGLMAELLSIPGSSSVGVGSVCVYQTEMKTRILGIGNDRIKKYGVVSEEIVRDMAESVKAIFHTDVAIATTGAAGPDSDDYNTPVGTAFVAVATEKGTKVLKIYRPGMSREDFTRHTIRSATGFCLRTVLGE